MKQFRDKRMAWAHDRLGGKCAVCGTTDGLQFDHVDPATKIHNVTHLLQSSFKKFSAEVDKCQLLCGPCHKNKTTANRDCKKGRDRTARKRQPTDGDGIRLESGLG